METAMLCMIRSGQCKETCGKSDTRRLKYACVVETNESTRRCLEGTQPEDYDDHIAGKGHNFLSHCNLVHKFIPVPPAMNIPEAKAAVEKEWEKLEKMPAWQLTKVRSKQEVIQEAHREGKTVHLATLMSSQESGVGTTNFKHSNAVRYSGVTS